MTDLHYLIATEGDASETINGVYARSSGIVWTTFGCTAEGEFKRYQAVQVLSAVWFLLFDYGPRGVLLSEIAKEGRELASFGLGFHGLGRGGLF